MDGKRYKILNVQRNLFVPQMAKMSVPFWLISWACISTNLQFPYILALCGISFNIKFKLEWHIGSCKFIPTGNNVKTSLFASQKLIWQATVFYMSENWKLIHGTVCLIYHVLLAVFRNYFWPYEVQNCPWKLTLQSS